MAYRHTLFGALLAELKQRSDLSVLFAQLESDPRRLQDVGFTLKEMKRRLRADQRHNSPLRQLFRSGSQRQEPVASAHDHLREV